MKKNCRAIDPVLGRSQPRKAHNTGVVNLVCRILKDPIPKI